MIRLNGLNKYYNKGRQNEIHVINEVTLDLPDKGMVAFFGRSGCGKTTLLNVIGGLDSFAGGDVLVDGQSIRRGTDTLRNRKTGYIFQNYNLNPLENCFENVADALRLCGLTDEKEISTRVLTALHEVGMARYYKRMPETLSGGQQQRIAIARAIVKGPDVILADEPTGNLDQENTLKIMDLLKRLSRDRLVLLVTHEANLVDHYCDQVIELSDGAVKSSYENEETKGLSAKSQRNIYLGDLTAESFETAGIQETVYTDDGEAKPLHLTMVRQEGKWFLRIDTPGVQILTDRSEIRLLEGKYEPVAPIEETESLMAEMPPLEGRRFGSLFTAKSALQSGFRANFMSQKKSNRLLRRVMAMLAAVFVFLVAALGTSVRELLNLEQSYNRSLFYVYMDTKADCALIEEAIANKTAGIRSGKLAIYYTESQVELSGQSGFFETFQSSYYDSAFMASATFSSVSNAEGMVLLAGDWKGEKTGTLISKAVADQLLNTTVVDYISNYEDLIHLSIGQRYMGDPLTISGVVDTNDPIVFVSDLYLMDYVRDNILLSVYNAEDYGFTVEKGQAILAFRKDSYDYNGNQVDVGALPYAGDQIVVHGQTFTIVEVAAQTEDDPRFSEMYVTYNEYDYSYTYSLLDDMTYILVNPEDYARLAGVFGETDPLLTAMSSYYEGIQGVDTEKMTPWQLVYMELYSADPEATAAWLFEKFGDRTVKTSVGDYTQFVITPEDAGGSAYSDAVSDVISQLFSIGIILAVLAVSMYFIMRAALMSRVREIGIYRAIGVSVRNVLWRFLVEAGELAVLTVFAGFIAASFLVDRMLHASALMENFLYYPWWMGLLAFVLLGGLCLFFGVLPVFLLLRKTPAQILAKYDI